MISPEEQDLWSKFNLAENNPDPGGGILYAIRYDTEGLTDRRQTVVDVVSSIGARAIEIEGGIGIDIANVNEREDERIMLMLEELSVVNEALEYHEAGLNPGSLEDLSNELRKSLLIALTGDQLAAFDFARIGIAQTVRDLKTAHEQSGLFNKAEQEIVNKLGEHAVTRAQQISDGSIVVIGL